QALQRFHKAWSPIGGQAHYLEFVAVAMEPEILGYRRVNDAERVREINAIENPQSAIPTKCKRGADEIAEPIEGANGSLLETRNEKRAGKVSRMVLDEMHFRKPLNWK